MKIKWLYLSAVLLTIGCSKSQDRTMQHLTSKHSATSHSQVDYQSKDPRKEEQSLSSVNINMDCVKTEGDYETDSHCIRISNVGDRTKSSEVYFDIIDKNASHKERHKGRIWDWISKKGNLYIYMDFKRKIVVSYMRLTGEMIMPRTFASGIVNVSINT